MRPLLIAIILAASMESCAAAGGDEPGLAETANGFYGVYRTFHPSDGVPFDSDRAKYAPFLSPALEKLLRDAQAAETRFATTNKGAPPLIEGDLFTSMFEGASTVEVGACSADGAAGQCAVKLEYSEPKNKPIEWTDTVYLVNTTSGWRVDDIGYGASWAFANKGRLSETLKQVLSFQ